MSRDKPRLPRLFIRGCCNRHQSGSHTTRQTSRILPTSASYSVSLFKPMLSDFVIRAWLEDVSAASVLQNSPSSYDPSRKTSSSRGRTPSPRKTLRELSMLDKPIQYVSDCGCLPPQMLPHWHALERICRDIETIPSAVALRLKDDFIHEHMINHVSNNPRLELEYETLLDVHADARQCVDSGSYEAQWNNRVHDRIISCALRPFRSHFECINMWVPSPIYLLN